MTKPGFCFGCRIERVFTRGQLDSWACNVCGAQRALTVDVTESNKGGDAGRFWASVKVTPFCWPWMRPCTNKGGPRFAIRGRDIKVARVAYFFAHGTWPVGGAFRTCSNAYCCRPDHIVDRSQSNISRTLIKSGRLKLRSKPMTRCKRGHAFTGDNISTHGAQRFCRLCRNLTHRRRYRQRPRPLGC